MLVVGIVIGSLSKLFWGYAVDKVHYKIVMVICLFLGGIFEISIGMVTKSRMYFAVWYVLFVVCDRGLITINPAILVKTFGLEIGTRVIFYVIFYS